MLLIRRCIMEVKLAFEYANAPENRYRCIILNAKEGKMFSAGNDISILSDDAVYQNPNYSSIVDEAGTACYSRKSGGMFCERSLRGDRICLAAVSDVVVAKQRRGNSESLS